MLKFREEIKIYVSMQPIDARKSIDGLCALVVNHFADNPQGGNVFIFFNKAKDKVKILWWHKNGFALYYKRLEKNRFVLPRNMTEAFEITQAQLHGLLAGLDFSLMRHFPEKRCDTRDLTGSNLRNMSQFFLINKFFLHVEKI